MYSRLLLTKVVGTDLISWSLSILMLRRFTDLQSPVWNLRRSKYLSSWGTFISEIRRGIKWAIKREWWSIGVFWRSL